MRVEDGGRMRRGNRLEASQLSGRRMECDRIMLMAGGSYWTRPRWPATGRTVYKGHLFVGDVPLHESGMQNHPLTPMTDPNLVRVLQRQTQRKVGLVSHDHVRRGGRAVAEAFERLESEGTAIA